ncbi:deoxyribonuclease IV [Mycoplasma mycoides]|uniref:Probable endonuclease 4 n=1 Tax=Mycoplasma mycoides subsp. capri TaxID=40477 RepID=A0AB38GDG8_MYCMC|nr:deoxyribonuclease IV [Mycoplasma mycoides]ADH21596.1 apurinic endonuclease Apn1 [synthetic Mycoplasma mycoides JCVI-syn1.0]AMW76332.1 Putative apurinic endonuclease [synthetic bacterium JCVI-Syn3.0]AMW76781.1 Putative apurinic endonuclease [synthetic bacterium JCVI-Syn2.0]AVX54618.1 Deoxyribonuclease IV [synthetic bacterium JCVI-Syn3A]QWN46309.1 deoxyribonuclease IV [synthetic bacterium JCVI-Syn3B]
MNKVLLGCHVSMNKQNNYLVGSVNEAISYKANTFMIFTGPPQSTLRTNTNHLYINQMHELMNSYKIDAKDLVVHAPYIINIANSVDQNKWKFAVDFLIQEIKRCEEIKIPTLVLHPGSHTTGNYKDSLNQIIKALDIVSNYQVNVKIALETMSGKGTEVCSKLEDFKYILDNVKNKDKVGVCLDTCHLHDAGYDLSKWDEFKEQMKQNFDLNKVLCIHLNDSKNMISSHKDRHANIGYGYVGFDTLVNVVFDKDFSNISKILETPYIDKKPPYKIEIEDLLNKTFTNRL